LDQGAVDATSINAFTWSFTWLVIPTTSMILADHAANQTLMCP